ncbi:MAG: DNA polymerase I [Patescibacteria group bacterium]|jgi:DNA polymerase-1
MAERSKLLVIDGNALLHRAWHALPNLQTKDGRLVNAVYGFLLVFLKVTKELKPTHLVVAFDRREATFRHEAYDGYKATREKQPDELYDQLPILKEVLAAFHVVTVEAAGFEADDLIGTIAARAAKENLPTVILTGDLDALQLVNKTTSVYTLRRGLTDGVIYDEKAVFDRYGLTPSELIDFRGLKGDPSDNLPGVKGIGEKTAALLIKKYKTLEKLYDTLEKDESLKAPLTKRIQELLRTYRENAFMTRQLSVINCDAPCAESMSDLEAQPPDIDAVVALFQQLAFTSLLAKLPESAKTRERQNGSHEDRQRQEHYLLVNDDKAFDQVLKKIKEQQIFALDTETTDINPFAATLLGLSFSWSEGEAYYIAVAKHAEYLEALRPILESSSVKKWGHNIKYDMEVLRQAGVSLAGIAGDTMVASYLLNPGSRSHDLNTVTFTEFGHRKIPITHLIGEAKGEQKSMADVPLDELAEYACEDADYTYRLSKKLGQALQDNGLAKLFATIEVPLIPVLATMEENGIKLDPAILGRLSSRVSKRLTELEQKITTLAGTSFNVASPKQLGHILFEKMKLSTSGISKTKTGFSTAAAELDKMRGSHPIIDAILEYRELAKLRSTYLDALPAMIDSKTNRLHTSFNQTITATGRLSSSEPNLQNIPVRTELGAEVRNAFIAESGMLLLSADYSQIELRIVASLANDATMLGIFKRGEDIHQATAARINNVSLAEVTSTMRYAAKEVNFGVLYGMGAWGLASRTGLSNEEARSFIDRYFSTFDGIKQYLDEVVVSARKLGYAETLFGRRRYLPELNSGVAQVRQSGERMAVNMPVQGTAADIMKLAMIRVFDLLPGISPRTKLVLQVHDELVLEVPREEVALVGKVVRDSMVVVASLAAPIEVNMKAGDSWGNLKAFNIV